ncbi:hypothetical protein PC111_g23962 [Phytophthora cactorum]|nr:hypothetical protein PC111_g23962 [Phytophthora cactorum]
MVLRTPIDLPKSMKTHPPFYVGRLRRYHDPQGGPDTPQTPQAFREEGDLTPRNETQPQTSSKVQRRKAKTHAALVDREATGTPKGPRTVEPQLGKLSTHHSHTAESTVGRTHKSASPSAVPGTPDLLKLAESLIHIGRGRPATNPIMDFRDLPAQLVQVVLKLLEDPTIPGLGGSITASPNTQSDLEDKNAAHLAERSAPQEVPRTRGRTRAPPPHLDRNGETHYHVERVVRERHLDGKRQLLVKLRGYPDSQNSWEPIERRQTDCSKAVAVWEQKWQQIRE